MRRYVNGLFALAHDPSSDVRKVVCTGLVQMLHLQPNRLQPHMHDIIEYMLQSTQVRPLGDEAEKAASSWLCADLTLIPVPGCT